MVGHNFLSIHFFLGYVCIILTTQIRFGTQTPLGSIVFYSKLQKSTGNEKYAHIMYNFYPVHRNPEF